MGNFNLLGKHRRLGSSVLALGIILAAAGAARASSITYNLSGSSTSGQAVSASAAFTVLNGEIDITLTNTTLAANTKAASELLTGLTFTISGGKTVSTLASAHAADVIKIGTYNIITSSYNITDMGAINLLVPPEWAGSTNALTWNGGTGPDYGIIGPGPYSGLNSSIAGNGPHNPYVNGTATFVFTSASIKATDTITGATFLFGTGPTVCSGTITPLLTSPVPLPAAVWSGLAMLGGLGLFSKFRRRA